MKMRNLSIFGVIMLSFVTLFIVSCNDSAQSHDEGETHWTYEGEEGPDHWKDIHADFSTCGGHVQSPVDIVGATTSENLKPLFLEYETVNKVEIINNGHSVQMNDLSGIWIIENSETMETTEFLLKQFHFHCPSEHTVNGKTFPMEVHLVHVSEDGGYAVIGVMVKEGAENSDYKWQDIAKHTRNANLFISVGSIIFQAANLGNELIGKEDDINDINWLSGKISRLRIFDDDKGIMNLSIKDINGEIMLVSQFTLFASTKKGNRPSYINSAQPDIAIPLYEQFIKQIKLESGCKVVTGKFGAHMDIALENNGPVTIIIDSKNRE